MLSRKTSHILITLMMLLVYACTPGGGSSENGFGVKEGGGEVINGPLGNSALGFEPSSKSFGNLIINADSLEETFIVTNISQYDLTLGSTTGETDDYTVTSTTCALGSILKQNETCQITVRFAPITNGTLSSIIFISYKAPNSTSSFNSGLSVTGIGTTLTFGGISSISNLTTTSVTLNWTPPVAASGYYIYLVAPNGILTRIQTVSDGTINNATVTGLSPSTSYTFRVRAIDQLGTPDPNVVNYMVTTRPIGGFVGGTLNAAEGTTSTVGLASACTDSDASPPTFSLTSTTSVNSNPNCSVVGNNLSCTPLFKTGHANWSETATVECSINGSTLTQNFTINVSNTNQAPQVVLSPATAQIVPALTAMTSVNASDTNTTNDTDRDLDPISYSCTFSGGGFAAGTDCASSLPSISYSLSAAGVLNWTPSFAAAVGNLPTTYTITITGTDDQTPALSGSTTLSVLVNPAVILNTLTAKTFPSNYIDQGMAATFNVSNVADGGAGTDVNMSYTCVFDQLIDGAVASGTNCTGLPGTISFNTTTGAFSWTPNDTSYGPYEIKFTGTNTSAASDSEITVIHVRSPFLLINLIGYWDGQFASGIGQGNNTPFTTSIKDLTTSSTTNDGLLNNFAETTLSGWTGNAGRSITGASDGPYRLKFDGVDDVVDFGSGFNSNSDMTLEMWVRPNSISTRGSVIASNADSTGKGIKIKQSYDGSGRIQAQLGSLAYDDAVFADEPKLYWQLNTLNGLTVTSDSSTSNLNGTKAGTGTFGVANPITTSSNMQVYRNASGNGNGAAYIDSPTSNILDNKTKATFEYWANYLVNSANTYGVFYWGDPVTAGANVRDIHVRKYNNLVTRWGIGGTDLATDAGPALSLNTWYHFVWVYDGTQANNADRIKLYINGVERTLTVGTIPTSLPNNNGLARLRLGAARSQNFDHAGDFSHFAIYDKALTSTQISAHYSTKDVTVCLNNLLSPTNDNWTYLTSWFNSTTLEFGFQQNGLMNGCQVTAQAGTAYSGTSTSLRLGRDENAAFPWRGEIGDLRIYSSSGNYQTSIDNFYKTGYRYGRPKEQVITDGLQTFYDAATARDNVTPYASGCSTTNTWHGTKNKTNILNLIPSDCTNNSQGWQGDGTKTSPYRLVLDGVDDTVPTNFSAFASDFTFVVWLRKASAFTGSHYLLSGYPTANGHYVNLSSSGIQCAEGGGWYQSVTQALAANTWYMIAIKRIGTSYQVYVNGVLKGQLNGSPASIWTATYMGNYFASVNNFSFAAFGYYNRALDTQEVLNLCQSFSNRFPSGQACAP